MAGTVQVVSPSSEELAGGKKSCCTFTTPWALDGVSLVSKTYRTGTNDWWMAMCGTKGGGILGQVDRELPYLIARPGGVVKAADDSKNFLIS